jgi:hypothetical protein
MSRTSETITGTTIESTFRQSSFALFANTVMGPSYSTTGGFDLLKRLAAGLTHLGEDVLLKRPAADQPMVLAKRHPWRLGGALR